MQIDATENDGPTTPTTQAWSEGDDCGLDISPQTNPCRFPFDRMGAFYGEIDTPGDIDWVGSLSFEIGKTYTIDVRPRRGAGVRLRCPKLVGLYSTNEILIEGTAYAGLNHIITITADNSEMSIAVTGNCDSSGVWFAADDQPTGHYKVTVVRSDAARSVSEGGTDLVPAPLSASQYNTNGGFAAGGTATRGYLAVHGYVTGTFQRIGNNRTYDADWYRTELTAGVTYRIDTLGINVPLNGIIIADSSGDAITHDTTFTPGTTGTYYVIAQNRPFPNCQADVCDPIDYRIELEVLP